MPRKATPQAIKEPIKLRSKKLANGSESLYLDQYKDGKRNYEYLNLYLLPEDTTEARIQNANTLATANAIKAQRIIELTTTDTGVHTSAARKGSLIPLSEWMKIVASSKLTTQRRKGEERSESYSKLLLGTIKHLEIYSQGQDIKLGDVTPEFCQGFIEYLKTANQLTRGRKNETTTKAKATATARTLVTSPGTLQPSKPSKPLSTNSARLYLASIKNAIELASEKDSKKKLATYLEELASAKSLSTAKVLKGAIKHLEAYKGKATRLKDVTPAFLEGFASYLQNANQIPSTPPRKEAKPEKKAKNQEPAKPLSPKSARNYFVCFKYAIQQAVDRGELTTNPLSREDIIPNPESHRTYLSLEELNRMAETECKNKAVKAAFMFACFCGLRYSDIETLEWSHITKEGKLVKMSKKQKKTKRLLDTYLADEALRWLPERDKENQSPLVFNLPSYQRCEIIVKEWAEAASVEKYVTFHTSRHTFATTLITLGEDIFTTSKLLGHANVNTTQIYAELVNEKKAKAVSRLNGVIKK